MLGTYDTIYADAKHMFCLNGRRVARRKKMQSFVHLNVKQIYKYTCGL